MSKSKSLDGMHRSASAEWWTPPEIVEPARSFWPFDLDPASCEHANRQIGASWFMTTEHDGLSREWTAATVWCNPPSQRGVESAWEWWVKAASEWSARRAQRVLFMVFNPSSFFTKAQAEAYRVGVPTPQDAARVEFRERVRYLMPAPSLGLPGVDGSHAIRGDAPPHGSALLLLPASPLDIPIFAAAYAHLGATLIPFALPNRAEP